MMELIWSCSGGPGRWFNPYLVEESNGEVLMVAQTSNSIRTLDYEKLFEEEKEELEDYIIDDDYVSLDYHPVQDSEN